MRDFTLSKWHSGKGGPAEAVVATARKLSIIYYKMVSNKESYNPKALEDYQKKI